MAEVRHPNGRVLTLADGADVDAFKAFGFQVVEKKAPAKKAAAKPEAK